MILRLLAVMLLVYLAATPVHAQTVGGSATINATTTSQNVALPADPQTYPALFITTNVQPGPAQVYYALGTSNTITASSVSSYLAPYGICFDNITPYSYIAAVLTQGTGVVNITQMSACPANWTQINMSQTLASGQSTVNGTCPSGDLFYNNSGVLGCQQPTTYLYGAIGDGSSHPAGSTLGITTLAGLAAYTVNGQTPYSFVSSYPYGVLFNLNPEVPSSGGSSTLTFQTTGTVETQIPTVTSVTTGATAIVIGDKSVTIDQTLITAGVGISGSNIPGGTTVSSITGYSGQWTVNLSAAITGNIASGSYITFAVRPASAGYSLPVVAATGINQGDVVAGTCITAGTQVDYVNHAKNEIELSAPLTCQPTALETLTFTPYWLQKVSVGMSVYGPTGAVPASTTVSTVNQSTGVVTISHALTANVTPDTTIPVSGGSPTAATPITFYRTYTDAEATNTIQMDWLGLQACINAAGVKCQFAVNANYQTSGPIILPIFAPYGDAQATITLAGQSGSLNGALIEPTADFGPGSAAISCGDPTGKSTNGRGIYTGATGYFCTGQIANFTLQPASFTTAFGLRPKWGGLPVQMDGIKQGPRLTLHNVLVQGFLNGSLFAGDHTSFESPTLTGNFNGLRFDDPQANLFGDEFFDRLNASGNAWAGISVSPLAYINGQFVKEYLASNAYAIWCEPGPTAGQCLQGVTMTNGNNENSACGAFKDGDIQDGWVAAGGRRTIANVLLINDFNANNGFGSGNVPTPLGGCEFAAYYDMYVVDDFRIEQVWPNNYPVVANAFAYILRTTRLDAFAGVGTGGFYMGGQGVWSIIQAAAAYGENIVGGTNGFAGAFEFTASWQWVTLEGPTFRARPIPFYDPTNNPGTLPMGSLVEFGPTTLNNVVATQLAGTTAGAALAGTVCQNWSSNPYANQLVPVVCVGGSRVPVLTATQATVGEYLKSSTSTKGTAVSATGITDTDVAGISSAAGASSTLTYVRPLWAGQQ